MVRITVGKFDGKGLESVLSVKVCVRVCMSVLLMQLLIS